MSDSPTKMRLTLDPNYDVTVHESGAKSSGDLPYYECLTQEFIDRCARRMTIGPKSGRYEKHNWMKGAHNKDYIMERLRHAQKHLMNLMQDIDAETISSDDDAAACCVNIMMAMRYQYLKELEPVEDANK